MSWKSFSYSAKPWEVLKSLTILSSWKCIAGEGTTAWSLGHSIRDWKFKSLNPWRPDLNLGLHYLACISFTCLGKNIAHENILWLWQMFTYRWNIYFCQKSHKQFFPLALPVPLFFSAFIAKPPTLFLSCLFWFSPCPKWLLSCYVLVQCLSQRVSIC